MANQVNEYIAATSRFAVVLRNFLLWSNTRREHLLCAFEGQDHHYYDTRVRTICHEVPVSHFHMGGKANVLELLALSTESNSLKGLKIAYFVDRDYEEPDIKSPLLYVTPHYSIENHYITRSAIHRILCSSFGMRELVQNGGVWSENPELATVLEFCWKVLQDYGNSLGLSLNSFLLAAYRQARERGSTTHGLPTKAFDEREFLRLFTIDEQGFHLTRAIDYKWLLEAFKTDSTTVSLAAYETATSYLKTQDATHVGRGKFLFALMLAILECLRSDSRRTKPKIFASKHACQIPESGIPLASLSSFADTPSSLARYLAQIKSLLGIAP